MKTRRIFAVTVAVLVVLTTMFSSFAENDTHVFDNANVLHENEISFIESRISEMITKYALDFFVATTDDTEGKSLSEFSDDYFADIGYGIHNNRDGILLLIDVESQSLYLSTSGYGTELLENNESERILGAITPNVTDGEYGQACNTFLTEVTNLLNQVENPFWWRTEHISDSSKVFCRSEIATLEKRIVDFIDEFAFGIYVVTTSDFGGYEENEYAEDYFRLHSYGIGDDSDGALLLFNMINGNVVIHTSGRGNDAINKDEIISMLRPLSDNNEYMNAVDVFLNSVRECLIVDAMPEPINTAHVVDAANLLTDAEEQALTERISGMVNQYAFDIVIVTTNDTGKKTYVEYADDYFDYNGFGQGESLDGILLLIDMGSRNLHISTSGRGITVLSNDILDGILDVIAPLATQAEYGSVCSVFLDKVDSYLRRPDSEFALTFYATDGHYVINFFIPAVVALFIVSILWKKHNNVAKQQSAIGYVRDGSFVVNASDDTYLYTTTTRVRVNDSSSSHGGGSSGGSHTSSSGNSHGGSSRGF